MRMWRFRQLMWPLLTLGALVVLSGCGGGSTVPVRSNFVEFSPEQQGKINVNSGLAYRLQTEDVLSMVVADQEEMSQDQILVLPDGSISLIGVGSVQVAGKTLAEVDSLVTRVLSREIREPEVSLIVTETQGKQIYVLGEVENPGLYKLSHGGLGIIGAITMAGGFTPDAAREGTVLVRVNEEGYLAQELDLSTFGKPEGIALATVGMQAFDIVYVPRSRIGDFAYFSKSVLSGLVYFTRMASDITYLKNGGTRGY